jgi:hypothetical protein
MRTQYPTTNEVLARRALGRSIDQRFVDWAIGLLEAGADTPHLQVLAGSTPPFNYFEMRQIFDVVVHELGLQVPAEALSAVRLYASERVGAVLTGAAAASELLAELHDYCIDLDYPRDLYNFYLPHNAWMDLQTQTVQWYWPGADRKNIASVVEDYFRVWLESSPLDA